MKLPRTLIVIVSCILLYHSDQPQNPEAYRNEVFGTDPERLRNMKIVELSAEEYLKIVDQAAGGDFLKVAGYIKANSPQKYPIKSMFDL